MATSNTAPGASFTIKLLATYAAACIVAGAATLVVALLREREVNEDAARWLIYAAFQAGVLVLAWRWRTSGAKRGPMLGVVATAAVPELARAALGGADRFTLMVGGVTAVWLVVLWRGLGRRELRQQGRGRT